MLELTVKLKSDDGARKYSKTFLVYEQLVLNSDEVNDLKPFVNDVLEEWKDDKPEDIQINIKMTV